jgi:hypothetical protein
MDKALYSKWLKSRLAEVTDTKRALRVQLDELQRTLTEFTETEAEETRLIAELAAMAGEQAVTEAAESLAFDVSPHVTAKTPEASRAKRLSEAQKRAFLQEHGWTVHEEIENQNIRVCWENGAKWYSLEDAYELEVRAEAERRLTDAGWVFVPVPEEGFEKWQRPDTADRVSFPVACQEAGMPLADVHPDWLS